MKLGTLAIAIGLAAVAVTGAVVVGFVAWWLVPGLTLPAGLVLGAIVAPPDAVSALNDGRSHATNVATRLIGPFAARSRSVRFPANETGCGRRTRSDRAPRESSC